MDVARHAIGVVLLLAGCRTTASDSPDEPRGERVTFDLQAMDGWECKLVSTGTITAGENEFRVTTTVDFTLVVEAGGKRIGPQVRAVEQRFIAGAASRTISLDAERITIESPTERRTQAASEHPDVARIIEDVTGAPRQWLVLDARATWVRAAGNYSKVASTMFPALSSLGLTWFLGYPELPRALREGARWEGLRPFTMHSPVTDVRLGYRLAAAPGDSATIEIHAEREGDLPLGLRGTFVVDGVSRIRTADGAFLGADVETTARFESGELVPEFGMRIESICSPN